MWDLTVSVPDHCLSFYFVRFGKSDPWCAGSLTGEAYSSCGLKMVLNAVSRTFGIFVLMFLRMKPTRSVRFAFPTMLST